MKCITNAQFREKIQEVVAKLDEQGKRSFDPQRGSCVYRGPDDTCCAVGHLIKDEFYSPMLESSAARTFRVQNAVELSLGRKLEDEHLQMMEELQRVHDSHWSPAEQTFTEALNAYMAEHSINPLTRLMKAAA